MKYNYFNTYSLSIIILFYNVLNCSYCFNSFGGDVLEIIMFLAITYFFDMLKIFMTLMIIAQ